MAFSFLFPGQGSQYTGMFKEHFEEFDEFQENLSIAEEFYKEDLKNIIFQEDPRLNDTYYTQPLLMVMSFSLFKCGKIIIVHFQKLLLDIVLEKFQLFYVQVASI